MDIMIYNQYHCVRVLCFLLLMLFVLQWNAQSIRAHGDEFKKGVADFHHHPDVICIQETWLSKQKTYSLPGYEFIRKDRKTSDGRSKGGGCGIFIKKGVAFSVVECDLSPLEAQIIEIWSSSNQNKTMIVNFYNPGGVIKVDDLDKLINNKDVSVIICGDFNSYNTLWGSDRTDRNGNVIESFIDTHDLFCLNDGSGTRLDTHTGKMSCIDLTFCSQSLAHKCSWFVHDDKWGSDHYPICLQVGIDTYRSNPTHSSSWSIHKANWDKFNELCNDNITHPSDCDSIEFVYNRFMSELNDAIDGAIPKTKHVASNKPPVPWWDDKCDEAVKEKKKALNILKRSSLPHDLIDYKRKKAIARRVIRDAKKRSWQNFCQGINSQTSCKTMWNKIKRISHNSSGNIIPVLKIDGKNIISDADKANSLAKTFAHVSSNDNYNDEFKNIKRLEEEKLHLNDVDNGNCINEPFTIHELDHAINSTKCTTPGIDGISARIVKRFPIFVRQVLLLIYNMIWIQGECPKIWKHAILIPIPKPGKTKTNPSSYRPIALTSVLCKIMERMVNKRILWFLESKRILNPIQSGFRKGRRTIDHLVRLESSINTGFASKASTVAVFLDIQKAYDMVWRKGVIIKMKKMGLTGKVVRWVNNFLTDRVIQVKINGLLSDKLIVENGVPQGSVISPLLFNIAVSDIPDQVSDVKISQYADDIAIWKTHKNIPFAIQKVQKSLNKIIAWCNQWGFQLSVPKTVAMLFSKKRSKPMHLKMNDSVVVFQKSTKFLGLFFDEKLSWCTHFHYIIDRCKPRINLLRCIAGSSWGADGPTLLRIYKSLIRPILEYGCEAFDSASDSLKANLDSIQYKALKICTGAIKGTSLVSLQVESGDPPLKIRRSFLTKVYALVIRANEEHPNNDLFLDNWQKHYYFQEPLDIKRGNLHRPFEARIEDTHHCIFKSTPPPWPFWDYVPIDTSVTIHSLCQGIDNNYNIRDIAVREINSVWKSYLHIYTDGSVNKKTAQVGCSFVIPSFHYARGFKLPGECSSYTAELVAMLMALEWIEEVKPLSVVIFSDSLSGIQGVSNFDSNNKIICEIQRLYKCLSEQGIFVVLAWVPGHVGIFGNEWADSVAKKAAVRRKEDIPVPIHISEIKSYYKKLMVSEWQNQWSTSTANLRDVQPTVSLHMNNWQVNREMEVQFHQLRMGTCYFLNNYSFKMNKHQDGLCQVCRRKDDVKHFLLECTRFTTLRKSLFNSITSPRHHDMKVLLAGKFPPIKEVIDYVNQCKVLKGY